MATNKMLKQLQLQPPPQTTTSTSTATAIDPFTHLACFVSALVHDAGHVGVPNAVLATEQPALASKYGPTSSIAEQHSVAIAWETLFLPEFAPLRSLWFSSEAELRHFRQLLVHGVLGTDLFDEKLRSGRQARWNEVFGDHQGGAVQPDASDRRATIVLEHLLQASDLSHTMQHWHVYRKWNERLFEEMHDAYQCGRRRHEPALSWYDDELAFMDNYVIPIAQKMCDCGHWGAAADEFMQYAMANRSEWSAKGRDLVQMMKTKMNERYDTGLFEL
jgi:3'5'-cyclic nucleotide phosphodiesterase